MASASTSNSTEIDNIQAVAPEDEKTLKHLLKIEDVLKKSVANMENIQETMENAIKEIEKNEALKFNLEKDVSELETYLKIETRDKNLLGNRIQLMRKMCQDIGDIFGFCQETLNSIIKGVETIPFLLVKQNKRNTEAIAYLALCYRDLERQENEIASEVLNEREQRSGYILNLDKEISNLKDKEDSNIKEHDTYHSLIKEYTEKIQSIWEQIVELENSNSELNTELQEKEKLHNELLSEMQKNTEQFQLSNEETNNRLLDIKDRILKKESTLNTLERSHQSQINRNEELLKNKNINENTNDKLKIEISNLKKTINYKKSEMDVVERELRTIINVETEESNNLEEVYAKEQRLLEEIENNIVSYANKQKDLSNAHENIESEIANLQKNKDNCLKMIERMEEQHLIILSEHEHLTEEVKAKNLLFTVWNKDQTDSRNKKTTDINNYNEQIEKIRSKEQESKKCITQEMDKIKLESDGKTFQLKKDLEEQLKLLKNEKECIKQEINAIFVTQTAQELALQKRTEQCNGLNKKIQTLKKGHQVLTKFDNLECASSSASLKTTNDAGMDTAPKRSYFDQLSGSSAEGVITMEQAKKYHEQAKLRQKLRDQRKASRAAKRVHDTGK